MAFKNNGDRAGERNMSLILQNRLARRELHYWRNGGNINVSSKVGELENPGVGLPHQKSRGVMMDK